MKKQIADCFIEVALGVVLSSGALSLIDFSIVTKAVLGGVWGFLSFALWKLHITWSNSYASPAWTERLEMLVAPVQLFLAVGQAVFERLWDSIKKRS